MKALLLVAGLAVATALVSGALLVGQAPGAAAPSPPAAPAPQSIPGAAPAEERESLADLERKVRDLEARIDELRFRADSFPVLPGASRTVPGTTAAEPVPEEPAITGVSAAAVNEGAEVVVRLLSQEVGKKESKRDAEIRRRIDRAVVAMALTTEERSRVEDIVRAHVERADGIALRAKEALKHSPYGFTEADRALVGQLVQDRARLDRETEQSLVQFVGPERWKAGLKSEKDQAAKEGAVRKLEKPW